MTIFVSTAEADVVRIYGAPDCGTWLKSPSVQHRAWLAGFLSGMNIEDGKDDFLDQITMNQAHAWVDSYCQKNPLSSVATGAFNLRRELREKFKK